MGIWICVAAMAMLACGRAEAATTLYVATNGRDTWSGRLTAPNQARTDGPLASLPAAVGKARALRGSGEVAPRIVVRGGKHFLESGLTLTSQDSGLTLEAAKGETPILYGGRKVTGWQQDGERFWSAPLPEVAAGRWDFRLLVVNGQVRPRARLPETGTFTHLTEYSVPWMSTTGGGWKRKPTQEELTTLKYRPGDLGPWLEVANAELTVYHMWDESVVGLAAHDPNTQTLRFSTPSGHPPGAFGVQKYVVWNVRQGMTRPGQWYLDRKAGKVVYWPLPGEAMARAEVLAPTTESVITLRGTRESPVEGVTLRGLTLSVTNTPLKAGGFGAGAFEGALQAGFTRDCRAQDLTITNVAGQGIKAWGGSGFRAEGCDIHHTGAGGIKADGDATVLADNHVHQVGVLYPSAIAVWVGGSRYQVLHNEIHDTPYSAIDGSGTDGRFENNLIYRAMQELHDGGGIYVTFCKRLVLRGNVIRDIVDTGGYGASAYYLDEQAEDCVVEDNLSVNVARPSHNHMARRNTLRNNVFVVKGDGRLEFPRCSGYTLEGNVVVADGSLTLRAPSEGIAALPGNVLYSGQGKVELETLADYSAQGRKPLEPKEGTVFADPLFVNPGKGDYRFRPGSPALKLGIKPLDTGMAGRRPRR